MPVGGLRRFDFERPFLRPEGLEVRRHSTIFTARMTLFVVTANKSSSF
jgi:hypothetical protein